MLKHRTRMTPRSSLRKGSNGSDHVHQSIDSLDYAEITSSTTGANNTLLKVKSMQDGLDDVGLPKAVWKFGSDKMNVYDEYSTSEVGGPSRRQISPATRNFYLFASQGNLSIPSSFVCTEFSGDDFTDDERASYVSQITVVPNKSETERKNSLKSGKTPLIYKSNQVHNLYCLNDNTVIQPVPVKNTRTAHHSTLSLNSSTTQHERELKVSKMKKHETASTKYTYLTPTNVQDEVSSNKAIMMQTELVEMYKNNQVHNSAKTTHPVTESKEYTQSRKNSNREIKKVPPPLPDHPPMTKSLRKRKNNSSKTKAERHIAFEAKIPKEYRLEPSYDPSFLIADQYIPEYYHSQLWSNPKKMDELNIAGKSRLTEPKDMKSVQVEVKLGDESLKEQKRIQKKEIRERLKENAHVLRKNKKIVKIVLKEEDEQRQRNAEKNQKLLRSNLDKQVQLESLIKEKKKRLAEKKYQERIARKVQHEAKCAEEKYHQKGRYNQDDIEYYKRQVEKLKRLAAEKEALIIQKEINRNFERPIESLNTTIVEAEHAGQTSKISESIVEDVITEKTVLQERPVAAPRSFVEHQNHNEMFGESEYNLLKNKSQSTLPTFNGDDCVEGKSIKTLSAADNLDNLNEQLRRLSFMLNASKSSTESEPNEELYQVKHKTRSRQCSSIPPKQNMIPVGVQTGRGSYKEKKSRLSQLSFALSDLSDEEVDRRISILKKAVEQDKQLIDDIRQVESRTTSNSQRLSSSSSKKIANSSAMFLLNL